MKLKEFLGEITRLKSLDKINDNIEIYMNVQDEYLYPLTAIFVDDSSSESNRVVGRGKKKILQLE